MFGWRTVAIRSRTRNHSQVQCRLLTNYKIIRTKVTCILQFFDAVVLGNIPLRVNRSSRLRFRNSDRVIFNLSLSSYDANFSKLDSKNLYESINYNFIQVFFWSFLSIVLSTCFVNEIYFSLVMRSSSVHPLYMVAILDNKICVIDR